MYLILITNSADANPRFDSLRKRLYKQLSAKKFIKPASHYTELSLPAIFRYSFYAHSFNIILPMVVINKNEFFQKHRVYKCN